MDVRTAEGKQTELIVGMWYVGVGNLDSIDPPPMIPAENWHHHAGEIAQYVGDGQFYDEGCDEPTDFDRYDYIVESHMGKLA